MILSDKTIKNYCLNKKMVEPFIEDNLQPCSLDLTLGDNYMDPYYGNKEINNKSVLILEPDDFILAHTVEKVNIPDNICAKIEGKSSLGRVGLSVHQTAGFIDPGFYGNITLEIKNVGFSTLFLSKGVSICQILFEELDTCCGNHYNDLDNNYQGQIGVESSKYEVLDEGIILIN